MSPLSRFLLMALCCFGTSQSALADDDEHRSWWNWWKSKDAYSSGLSTAQTPAVFQQECGACHIAYPAGMMPAGSWQHLMANLSQHFGSDASLDAASHDTITTYLTRHAGTYKRVAEMPPDDRITQTYWFQRKHNKHVASDVWARASIGSRSNCAACHPGSAQGNFNEHSVRIPG